MPASVGRPSSTAVMPVWFIGLMGHLGETAGKSKVRPLFSLLGFQSEFEGKGLILWYFLDWEGQASWANLPAPTFWC